MAPLPKLGSFYRCLPGVNSDLSDKSVIAIWQNDYLARIQGLAGCIDYLF
jgi:hypothetical protein